MCRVIRLRRFIILAFFLTALSATTKVASAQNQEYPLKASFLSIFGDLVTWKNAPDVGGRIPLTIGILGSDPFDAALTDGRRFNYFDDQIAKKVRAGRNINVRRFPSPDKYQPCHMLYIAEDVAKNAEALKAILKATQGTDVLLVGDTRGLAEQGITINMVVDAVQNRVQLEINPDAAGRAGLSVHPRLYKLPGVRIVRQAAL